MDRFVWFVLLVVISHLVTEFTRVTGYTRGPRQDVVMVNDSSIPPIRVQNLVLYPGQEYGHFEQQNQQYYSGNNRYSNYASNFFSNLFNPSNNNNNNMNNNNNNGGQQQQQNQQQQISGNIAGQTETNGDVRTFSFQPLIDSIFEIPISTLRAVNNLVGRLTGSYQQQQQQQKQPQQQDQQQHMPQQQAPHQPQYPSSYYGGMQKSASASSPSAGAASASASSRPKNEFEMFKRIRQSGPAQQTTAAHLVATVAPLRKSSISGFRTHQPSPAAASSMKNTKTSWLKQQSL